MNLRTFNQTRISIQQSEFKSLQTHPLLFAIERAEFEKRKLKRMIAAGEEARAMKTVRAKIEAWKRKITRIEATQKRLRERFEDLQNMPRSDFAVLTSDHISGNPVSTK